MTNWDAAYNRLYSILDGYSGSDFIRTVQEVDIDMPNYTKYIQKRRDEEKSTTKKDYFYDILMAYPADVRQHVYEVFLSKLEGGFPEQVKEIRTILGGGTVDIRKEIIKRAIVAKEVDEELLVGTLKGLESHPEADKLYRQALSAYNTGKDARHILDDIRLSLEYYLRDVLKNDKTLENQMLLILAHLKGKGVSVEILNLFRQLFDYLNKYQNENVKHWDEVKPSEVDLIINLTNSVYRFLLNNE
jgi:hypothetical protein